MNSANGNEELRFHLRMAEEDALRRGESTREARLQAGGLSQASEAVRDQRALGWLGDFLRDIRHAVRLLANTPAFTFTTLLLLALGIGANTAIFSVVNAVFLRPLPYPESERIFWVTEQNARSSHASVMMPDFVAWKRDNAAFENLSAYQRIFGASLLASNQAVERVQAARVTPDFFAMLGVQPQIGRDFQPGESEAARSAVVLISDSLWRNYLDASPDVLGKSVVIDNAVKTVIGILPRGFVFPEADGADLWLPDAVNARGSTPSNIRRDVSVIGRLKPGVTLEQARSNLEVITRRMDGQFAPFLTFHPALSVQILPLQEHLTSGSRTAVAVLMGAVGCVLLIVCANIANLLLARSVAREREIAIRVAMGASRFRVVRLLLAESLLLGSAGGLLGLLFASFTSSALAFLLPATISHRYSVDAPVLGFAAACSFGVAILFGLVPSLIASKLDLNTALKEGGAHQLNRHGRSRLSRTLAIAQLALSLTLLIGAGLLMRSFVSLLNVNLGFDALHVLVANIWLSPPKLYGPARQVNYFRRAVAAVQALPGVQFAAVASEPPLGATVVFPRVGLQVKGQPATEDEVYETAASADYFAALHIALLRGRFLDERDKEGTPLVTVISESAARILFKDRNPIGQKVLDPKPVLEADGKMHLDENNQLTVVGVVVDIRHDGREGPAWPELYQPYAQSPVGQMNLVVRGYSDPSALAPAIRKAVQAIDRQQPVFGLETMETLLSRFAAQRRQRAFVLGAFALLSLVAAIVGVYGVVAYSVMRKTHEICLRIALGAQRSEVVRMVVGEGLTMALIGIAIGLVLALPLTRVLAGFLFGIGPGDVATFASVSIALMVATCVASYIPAQRAARIDPVQALRHE